jgi:hypothetical protein
MIGAVVALGLATVLLAGVVLALVSAHASERREWVAERKTLVDRAIASHTGEILALDRGHAPPREPRSEHLRPVAEGL